MIPKIHSVHAMTIMNGPLRHRRRLLHGTAEPLKMPPLATILDHENLQIYKNVHSEILMIQTNSKTTAPSSAVELQTTNRLNR